MRRPAKAGIGAWRNRFPPRGDVDLPDIRVAVDILFREAHPGGHVEHVLDARAGPAGGCQLGQVVGHRSRWIDDAAAGKHAERHAGHRLGHRLRQMQRALAHAVEISFVDDRAVLYDEEAVGVGLVEQAGKRPRPSLAVGDRQRIEIVLGSRQFAPVAVAAPHFDRRQDLADVLEGPTIPRRPVPVDARRDQRGRRPGHDRRRGGIRIAVRFHDDHSDSTKGGRGLPSQGTLPDALFAQVGPDLVVDLDHVGRARRHELGLRCAAGG